MKVGRGDEAGHVRRAEADGLQAFSMQGESAHTHAFTPVRVQNRERKMQAQGLLEKSCCKS